LEQYLFWQDEAVAPSTANMPVPGYKRIRGYPIRKDDDSIVVVEIQPVGSWAKLAQCMEGKDEVVEATGMPGSSVIFE
jgi:hypothetical protein